MSEIDDIIKKSSKAEFGEKVDRALVEADKAVCALITDKDDTYEVMVISVGAMKGYELRSILDVGKLGLEDGE